MLPYQNEQVVANSASIAALERTNNSQATVISDLQTRLTAVMNAVSANSMKVSDFHMQLMGVTDQLDTLETLENL